MKLIVQPESDLAPVIAAIRRARKTIDVCIFRLDRTEIEKALATSVTRGVRVWAQIAQTNSGGAVRLRQLEERLLADGVTVARSGDDLLRYHGKYMVADDTLHLFGFNFTKQDIEKSRSFAIATRDRRAVKEAQRLFEADMTRQPYAPQASNLVVSPETSRPVLSKFLKGARSDLAIYDIKLQDPAILQILRERASKGVTVRLLGRIKGSEGSFQVRDLKAMRLHVRAIVRDKTRAFVGSQSLRKLELDRRREVGLLISNPVVARKILSVFDADWDASAPAGKKAADESAKDAAKSA
jgi:phosphatidylserine/phosphatidylglycerophosphate/cardiolipin synthase-like enzyme